MTKKNDSEQLKQEASRIAKGVAMLDIEMVPVSQLIPYENNSKVHGADHIKRLADNIKHEGLQESLLVEENMTIVAGHGRLEAVKSLGWEEVPVRVMRGYTEAQCKIHRVSSNLTVSNKYDSAKQADELNDIQSLLSDEELENLSELTGYSERDIEVLSDDITEMADLDELDLNVEAEPEPKKTDTKDDSSEETETPQKMVRIVSLLGVDEITPTQARTVRKFVAMVEIDSPESLVDFCEGYLSAMENDNE